MTRANDGAAPAPQEACLRQASGPVSGYAGFPSVGGITLIFRGRLSVATTTP